MSLYRYLTRLYDTITSRQEIEVESLEIHYITIGVALFSATLRFFDNSRLVMEEEVEERPRQTINKIRYKYHYQDAENRLISRYDNVPHHLSVSTFPHHKHEGAKIVAADPVDLSQVLQEIDRHLYE
ncbi:MAG: DUF6516 family protein [Anaerolineae bacterium]